MKRIIFGLIVLIFLPATVDAVEPTDTLTLTYLDSGLVSAESGKPETLRKAVFAMVDGAWPDWYTSEFGKKYWMGAVKQTTDCHVLIGSRGVLEIGLSNILNHMRADGINVVIRRQP